MPKLHLKDCGLDIKGEINRYMTYLKQKPGSLEDVIAKQQSPYQESAYQDKFKKELDKAGRGIGSMTPKEKTAFFNKVEESVQAEALAPEKQKENDKLMKDFIAKGGKVQNIPIGKRNFQGNKLIVRAAQKKLKEERELKEKDGANTSTTTGSASRNAKKKYRFGYRVAEKQPKGNDIEEGASELIKKAVEIAKKMAGNMTGATKEIEKLARGLSKEKDVSTALAQANEEVAYSDHLKVVAYIKGFKSDRLLNDFDNLAKGKGLDTDITSKGDLRISGPKSKVMDVQRKANTAGKGLRVLDTHEEIKIEARSPEEQKKQDKMMKDFLAKGGKVKKLKPGIAKGAGHLDLRGPYKKDMLAASAVYKAPTTKYKKTTLAAQKSFKDLRSETDQKEVEKDLVATKLGGKGKTLTGKKPAVIDTEPKVNPI